MEKGSKNDYDGLFQEYGQSDKILDKFEGFTFSFLVRENYLEFCKTSRTPRTGRLYRYF